MDTQGFGDGSYDPLPFAQMMGASAPGFWVASSADWEATIPAGSTRTLSLAAGAGVACGVRGSTSAATTVSGFAANGGTPDRYDLVVARWDWSINDVVFTILQGTTSPPLINNTFATDLAKVNGIPGVLYDGPTHLVKVRPGVTTFVVGDVTDLRKWPPTRTLSGGLAAVPWTPFVSQNGWTAKAESGYEVVDGWAEVLISFSRSSWNAGQKIATLPEGVRPRRWQFFTAQWAGQGNPIEIRIEADGDVYAVESGQGGVTGTFHFRVATT